MPYSKISTMAGRLNRKARGGQSRRHHQAARDVDKAIQQVLTNISPEVVSRLVKSEQAIEGSMLARTRRRPPLSPARYRCDTGAAVFESLVQLALRGLPVVDLSATSAPQREMGDVPNPLPPTQVVMLCEFLFSYLSWLLPPTEAFPASLPSGGPLRILTVASTASYACPRIPSFACEAIYNFRVLTNSTSEGKEGASAEQPEGKHNSGAAVSPAKGSKKAPSLPPLPTQPTADVLRVVEELPLMCARAVSSSLGDAWEVSSATANPSPPPQDKVFALQAAMYLLCYRLLGAYPRWVALRPGSQASLATECVSILHTEALFTQLKSEGIEKRARSLRSRGGARNRRRRQELQAATAAASPLGLKRKRKTVTVGLSEILATCRQPSRGATDALFALTTTQLIAVETMCLLPPNTPCDPAKDSSDSEEEDDTDEGSNNETPPCSPDESVSDGAIPPSPPDSEDEEEATSSSGGDDEDASAIEGAACVGGFLLSWALASAETRASMMVGRKELVVGADSSAKLSPSGSPVIAPANVVIASDLLFALRGPPTTARPFQLSVPAQAKSADVAATLLAACLPTSNTVGNPVRAVGSNVFLRWLRNVPRSAKRPAGVLPRIVGHLATWEVSRGARPHTPLKPRVCGASAEGADAEGEEEHWSVLERLPSMLSHAGTLWLATWVPFFLRRWGSTKKESADPLGTSLLPNKSDLSVLRQHQRKNAPLLAERLRVSILCCSTISRHYLLHPSPAASHHFASVYEICGTLLGIIHETLDKTMEAQAAFAASKPHLPEARELPQVPDVVLSLIELMEFLPLTHATRLPQSATNANVVARLLATHIRIVTQLSFSHHKSPLPPTAAEGIIPSTKMVSALLGWFRNVVCAVEDESPAQAGLGGVVTLKLRPIQIAEQAALPSMLPILLPLLVDAIRGNVAHFHPMLQATSELPPSSSPARWFLHLVDVFLLLLNLRLPEREGSRHDAGVSAVWEWGAASGAEGIITASVGPLVTSHIVPALHAGATTYNLAMLVAALSAAVDLYSDPRVPVSTAMPVMQWVLCTLQSYHIFEHVRGRLEAELTSCPVGISAPTLDTAGLLMRTLHTLLPTILNRNVMSAVVQESLLISHLLLDRDAANAAEQLPPTNPDQAPPPHVGDIVDDAVFGSHGYRAFTFRLGAVMSLLRRLLELAARNTTLPEEGDVQPNTPNLNEAIVLQVLGFASNHVHLARSAKVRSLGGPSDSFGTQYVLSMLELLEGGMRAYSSLPVIANLKTAPVPYGPAEGAACRRYAETVVKSLLVLVRFYWVPAVSDNATTDQGSAEEGMPPQGSSPSVEGLTSGYSIDEVDVACIGCLRAALSMVPFSNISVPFMPEATSRVVGLLLPLAVRRGGDAVGGALVEQLVGLSRDTLHHCNAAASEARSRRMAGRRQRCISERCDSEDDVDFVELLSVNFAAYALPALSSTIRWEAAGGGVSAGASAAAGLVGCLDIVNGVFAFTDTLGTTRMLACRPDGDEATLLDDLHALLKSALRHQGNDASPSIGCKRAREGDGDDAGGPQMVGNLQVVRRVLQATRSVLMSLTRCVCSAKGVMDEAALVDSAHSHSEVSPDSSSGEDVGSSIDEENATTSSAADDHPATETTGASLQHRGSGRLRDKGAVQLRSAIARIVAADSSGRSRLCRLRDTVQATINATGLLLSIQQVEAADGVSVIGDGYQTLVACLDLATASRRWMEVAGGPADSTAALPTAHLTPRQYLLPLILSLQRVVNMNLPTWRARLENGTIPLSLAQAVEWFVTFLDLYSLEKVIGPPTVSSTFTTTVAVGYNEPGHLSFHLDDILSIGDYATAPPSAPSAPRPPSNPGAPPILPPPSTPPQPPVGPPPHVQSEDLNRLQESLLAQLSELRKASC